MASQRDEIKRCERCSRTALLDIGDLAIHKYQLHVFIEIGLLGPQIGNLLRLPKNCHHKLACS
jgi:hypothetical protein